ncbi:hypothetical protein YC2023_081496 [Brassica napus]
MDLWTKVKVLMGRTREGRACRWIKVQMCPQMLVPRKIKLQNRAFLCCMESEAGTRKRKRKEA